MGYTVPNDRFASHRRSMPLTTDQVVERLMETVGGQIVACNMVAGIQNGLVDAPWTTEVLAWMGKLGDHQDYATNFLQVLDDLRLRSRPSSHPDIRLRGADAPSPFDVEVSHVLPVRKLWDLMSREDQGRLGRGDLASKWSEAEPPTIDVDRWRHKPTRARLVRVHPQATLGPPHGVVWFTSRAALNASLAAVPLGSHAQRTRDLLGLVHHQEGVTLAAMHFQPPVLSACPSARPTFADAGGDARRFKAWPDDEAARSERRWGRTVDLRALSESAPSVDGCPERVTKSIDRGLPNDATFEFELLGTVDAAADQDDAAFARRLKNGRTAAELGAELRALTQPNADR